MKEAIASYVGLDVHKDSIAIAVADEGRAAPRFIGTVVPESAALRGRAPADCHTDIGGRSSSPVGVSE